MSFTLVVIFSFSVLIPGMIALFRVKNIDSVYYPVLFCIWLGCLNEFLSFSLVINRFRYQSVINNNIYALFEAILITAYFENVNLFQRKWMFRSIIAAFLLTWIADNVFFHPVTVNNTNFKVFYSIAIVFMSINIINKIIFSYKRYIPKDATFILCITFIIYFTYQALIQTFFFYGLKRNSNFLMAIYTIMIYINLGTNLLYTLAVLWMPKRARFIL